ncbi:TaqI-like C-terminal specificity domain-containing protein [Marivirga tractuosa]|uniref:DUF7149 domain-containing protein n=1 Tax=Marivirga tractuosa TaxID=1006 RepID=UPI0035D0A8C5
MTYNILTPRKSLNKAFLKVKPNRSQIDSFKHQLSSLLEQIKEGESEEFHKNIIADFLKNTYYAPDYYINTKGRNDQVIHNGKNTKSSVGVIIEAKSPTNKTEMPLKDKINTKAMQELVLYFLRERITQSNTEVRHLVITNIHEWFVFDAHLFDTLFARDKKLVSKFKEFEAGTLSATNTEHFYKEIAKPAIEAVENEISFTYFNINDYDKALKSSKEHDSKLIVLYKLLSPEHLLKLPFANDSNSLDKSFYNELLYIMGLEEFQEKGKKLIQRKPEKDRIYGTLLESVISKLESRGELHRLDNPQQYGKNTEERLFNVGLQLVITWLNRILFLKLLEAQLLDYNQGDKSFSFLSLKRIGNFNKLADLFFNVLAVPTDKRKPAFQEAFAKVPYLNSSLFEANELENRALHIDTLDATETIPIYRSTVLKDPNGKKRTGELPVLEYLFAFLESYDFSSEGSEEIQEENKTLINASVLGLIFEKINGYKDGSFFTPGFITMYMCRETIRRAVVEKFNTHYEWKCKDFGELKEDLHAEIKHSDLGRKAVRAQANQLINDLKICDPAVGSGHFLVSALNELIAIKHELSILCDRNGEPLSDYQISIENDELIIIDLEDRLFTYQPTHDKSQRMQEALFHEKQELIEKCLFGVDINPNSVKICRLRLWIELLKSAYYKRVDRVQNSSPVCDADYEIRELETLPNIDINIKTGNSLVSRFSINADLSDALKSLKYTISDYRTFVSNYKEAKDKEYKRGLEIILSQIKDNFQSNTDDGFKDKITKSRVAVTKLLTEINTKKQWGEKIPKKVKDKLEKATKKQARLEKEKSDILNNKIFENAFEWRFEFPEVLDNEGNFIGFDVVIGNPPYGVNFNKSDANFIKKIYETFNSRGESYVLFIEKGQQILKLNGRLNYITPDTVLNLGFTQELRNFLLQKTMLEELVLLPSNVFNDAVVDTILLFTLNVKPKAAKNYPVRVKTFGKKLYKVNLDEATNSFQTPISYWSKELGFNVQSNKKDLELIDRIDTLYPRIEEFAGMYSGIKVYEVGKGKPSQTPEIRDEKPYTSLIKKSDDWSPFIDGKHIGFYTLLWNENNWINYGEWLAAPRNAENFEGEKILIRKITSDRLISTYVPYTSYCNTLLFVLKLKKKIAKHSYQSILGILNSKFIGWYFRKKFQISDDDTFPQIMIRDILQFSIPNVWNSTSENIDIYASRILEAKMDDPKADTTSLEQEIDQIVYELYGLTEEEIKIVEGGVG